MSDYTGYEHHIDWDAVSGMDLATKPRLLARWINSPERQRQERKSQSLARKTRRRRALQCRPGEITSINPCSSAF
jgi:uncharacterized protein YndB with AHSA1/START domain